MPMSISWKARTTEECYILVIECATEPLLINRLNGDYQRAFQAGIRRCHLSLLYLCYPCAPAGGSEKVLQSSGQRMERNSRLPRSGWALRLGREKRTGLLNWTQHVRHAKQGYERVAKGCAYATRLWSGCATGEISAKSSEAFPNGAGEIVHGR
ncbi:hypothetical protein BU26DRAFT_317782 [Trematosphaeria pertusa]|uniref:Uncharacterized protein n=1 Tax=Trematosphaeria pertusa TaxID=390896 RepID=A0A6A6IFN1_9PLEO|nr:uncharacterized protein BU26DRAFT_317782 [Trematosphaeria pertusa]KAF2249384.1 hypothetical protein BU26DRAFT_317782 [Trematosphaeria pertusa]